MSTSTDQLNHDPKSGHNQADASNTSDFTLHKDNSKHDDTSFNASFLDDINSMLAEIGAEIDVQYPSTPISAQEATSAHPLSSPRKRADISLDFVPAKNHVARISDVFTYQKQLGVGASCRVLLVCDKEHPQRQYALKEMNIRDEMNRSLFATEYKIMQHLAGNVHILSYHSSYIDRNCYYLCTQYCSGGTMLDRILLQGHFNERECSEFMKDVLLGIQHMHHRNVVHRDIKCRNLVFDHKESDAIVKIIDFGTSELITDPLQVDRSVVGTLHYLPPELVRRQTRNKQMLYKADMWAVGVVCYVLVSGKVPFYGANQPETFRSIRHGKFEWPQNVVLSESCKDFISRLLDMNVHRRMSADAALKHPWICQKGKALEKDFGDSHLNQIRVFSTANKLQKVLINSILSEMEPTQKRILLRAVRDLDMNGNQQIDDTAVINYILMHDREKITKHDGVKAQAQKFMSRAEELKQCGIFPETEHSASLQSRVVDQSFASDVNIEAILNEIDEDEQRKQDEAKEEQEEDEEEFTIMALYHDDEECTEMPMDELDEQEAVEQQKLLLYSFSSSQSVDFEQTPEISPTPEPTACKMSVLRFSELISNAEKEYDVHSLIDNLHPTASGNIPLRNIYLYRGPLHSDHSDQ